MNEVESKERELDSPDFGEPEARVLAGKWATLALIGAVVVILCGLVLRFWTRSALWLDEALTIDIARLPIKDLPSYLRRDGAPPLFYVLLHFWMGIFGQSNAAVRALPGVLSVATIPLAWLGAKRFAGKTVAAVVVVILSTAPFAIYYATEARMYSLVMFLTAAGIIALQRLLTQPKPGNVIAFALCIALLLYSQYWAIYLTGSLGLWLLWLSWRAREKERSNARWALGSVIVGFLLFIPWLPTFVFQSRHTGTPWSKAPNFAAVINAVTGFTDNQATTSLTGTDQGRLLAVFYFALAALAVFGIAKDRFRIELDIRTRSRSRGITFVVAFTLLAAITGGILSGSAFSVRYASVIFIPLLILIAYGSRSFLDPFIRGAIVAVMAISGLALGVQNIWTARTQAPTIAKVLNAHARPGDVIAFCPDQLGPPVYRLVAHTQTSLTGAKGKYHMVTFPRRSGPAFVDWVTYDETAKKAKVITFAKYLDSIAVHDHRLWFVSAVSYQGFGVKCQQINTLLDHTKGLGPPHTWVNENITEFYEPMSMVSYTPTPRPSQSP